jgi:hypothetical protein
MALEVSEIGIRMRVGEDSADEKKAKRKEDSADQCGDGELDREEIVSACVRRVLKALALQTMQGR